MACYLKAVIVVLKRKMANAIRRQFKILGVFMSLRMANIRLNAYEFLNSCIYELDKEYREVDAQIYYLENGTEKDLLLRKLENITKMRGRFKYRRFMVKCHISKKNQYNATQSLMKKDL